MNLSAQARSNITTLFIAAGALIVLPYFGPKLWQNAGEKYFAYKLEKRIRSIAAPANVILPNISGIGVAVGMGDYTTAMNQFREALMTSRDGANLSEEEIGAIITTGYVHNGPRNIAVNSAEFFGVFTNPSSYYATQIFYRHAGKDLKVCYIPLVSNLGKLTRLDDIMFDHTVARNPDYRQSITHWDVKESALTHEAFHCKAPPAVESDTGTLLVKSNQEEQRAEIEALKLAMADGKSQLTEATVHKRAFAALAAFRHQIQFAVRRLLDPSQPQVSIPDALAARDEVLGAIEKRCKILPDAPLVVGDINYDLYIRFMLGQGASGFMKAMRGISQDNTLSPLARDYAQMFVKAVETRQQELWDTAAESTCTLPFRFPKLQYIIESAKPS